MKSTGNSAIPELGVLQVGRDVGPRFRNHSVSIFCLPGADAYWQTSSDTIQEPSN